MFDAELGFFGDVEAGVIGEGVDEGGDDFGIAAPAEEEGGAEADLPGEFGVFEEGDELVDGQVGFVFDGLLGEEFGEGEFVGGVDAAEELVVAHDAVVFGLGGVVEVGAVGVAHGVDDEVEGAAEAGGDGFVCVSGEAVALFDEAEFGVGGGGGGFEGAGGVGAGERGGKFASSNVGGGRLGTWLGDMVAVEMVARGGGESERVEAMRSMSFSSFSD